jgi:hypothetical protein
MSHILSQVGHFPDRRPHAGVKSLKAPRRAAVEWHFWPLLAHKMALPKVPFSKFLLNIAEANSGALQNGACGFLDGHA